MLSALLLLLAPAQPTVEKDIVFSQPAGVELKMDIWQPAESGKNRPAVIVVHGGGWTGGRKEQMNESSKALASNGFVVANVSYRLGPQNKWPSMVDDVQTAVRCMRANASKYGIDKKRFGATGVSAGGHLSLFLGFCDTLDKKATEYAGESSRVQAVLNFFGPTNLTSDFTATAQMMLGGIFPDLKSASPMSHLDTGDAPVFTFHGDKDQLVPINQAKVLHEKLKELKIDNELSIIKGGGHNIEGKKPEVALVIQKMVDWLKEKLAVSG